MTGDHKFRLVLPDDWTEVNVYDIPGLIAVTLEPYDGIEFSSIKQAAIKMDHEEHLKNAVLTGDLVTRNRLTTIPERFAIGEQLKRSVLFVEEFQEYVSQFGISVEIAEPAERQGRYNLEQAATKIAEATGESAKAMLEGLVEAVGNYELPVHTPGSSTTYMPITVRSFYEEAYWDDLNEWLEKTHPRLEWRFPDPEESDGSIPGDERANGYTFPSPPSKNTPWYELTLAAFHHYKNQHQNSPSKTQLWGYLWSTPPGTFDVSSGHDDRGNAALFMGGKSWSRPAFNRSWDRWSTPVNTDI